mgnify:CR=1 FL=1
MPRTRIAAPAGSTRVRGIFLTVIYCSEPGIEQAPPVEIREVYESIISRRTNGRNGAAS